jgi:hypothetical protein
MVILLTQYNIRPDKATEFTTFVQSALPILVGAPAIVELQAYRNLTGENQVTALYYFDDLAGYATWRSDAAVSQLFADVWQYTENMRIELLGPSPFLPQPLRPQR